MQIKSEYPRVQLSGWRVWPVAALFSYAFVPLHLRVLFINCVALFWSTYLLMRAKSMAKQAAASAGGYVWAGWGPALQTLLNGQACKAGSIIQRSQRLQR
jgi:hypothetical protein